MKKKIIIFGGTFDPIHNGHLIVAQYAAKHIGAMWVVFVPARRSPHKRLCPMASGDDRLAMIRLAIAGRGNFVVSDCELLRAEPSYTIDTLRCLRHDYGDDAEFYLLAGADGLKDMPQWHMIEELLDECNVCLMARPGYEMPDIHEYACVFGDERIEKLGRNILKNPLVDISGTQIRQKLRDGEDVSGFVPEKVLDYILSHRLYRCAEK